VTIQTYELSSFQSGGQTIKAREPIVLQIVKDNSQPPFHMVVGIHGIVAFGENPDDAIADIQADLDIMWRHYALANDSDLTPAAQEIKKDLLETFVPAEG
jgi:hypothetical protein